MARKTRTAPAPAAPPPEPPPPFTAALRREWVLEEIESHRKAKARTIEHFREKVAEGVDLPGVLEWNSAGVYEAHAFIRFGCLAHLYYLTAGVAKEGESSPLMWEDAVKTVRALIEEYTEDLTRRTSWDHCSTSEHANARAHAEARAKVAVLEFLKRLLRLMEKPAVDDAPAAAV